ncbi:aminodeoxyfutalosine deaminase [Parafrankia irregularis]|uniref:Aminodeoxyfutalosine deaminase n=1 Tax=Parafrankia irregularis TaxID=795642 RepID=A0A0S4QER8_9ACTN|nr:MULTISPECIES: adenosine deaminase [Parafrankia]CUU53758.1 aminodeoxyfutalosine deaminase [Parafrankia irregularis]
MDRPGPAEQDREVRGQGAIGQITDEQFVDTLPKVELHVHLEGSMRPGTLLRLARRHDVDHLPTDLDALRAFYRFRDFDHFIEVYLAAVQVLRDEEDFRLLARETALGLAEQRVRYAEITFTPWLHVQRGVDPAAVFAGVEAGRLDAERETGIQVRWITDIPGLPGTDNVHSGERTLELALEHGGEGVIALGLGGPEVGVGRPQFGPVFTAARDAGLHCIPHAGETTGARTIWDALEFLHAERIGHGTSALDDPALVEHLRRHHIPLEVSPTSNLCTGAVASYAAHPLPRMIAEGLDVNLNSDDPPMFNTTLRQEYLHALRSLSLTRQQVFDLAAAAVEHSFLPEPGKARLRAEFAVAAVELGVTTPAVTTPARSASASASAQPAAEAPTTLAPTER